MTGKWRAAFLVFKDRRILSHLFLGLSSGLPYTLILSTLSIWLTESGYPKTAIGYWAGLSITYPCKFLWAEYVDRWQIPWLTRALGQRRSWMLVSQFGIMSGLIGMSFCDPIAHPTALILLAMVVAFSSATQDIACEAYRIEMLPLHHYGAGASMSGFGYRIGMLISGAGALYLSAFLDSWSLTYLIMGLCMLIGVVTVFMNPEPLHDTKEGNPPSFKKRHFKFIESAHRFFTLPHSWVLFAFIAFYKLADSMLVVMAPQFILELGFNKLDIANISKLLGISMMMGGVFMGGLLMNRFGPYITLRSSMIAHLLVILLFIAQAQVGHNMPLLVITMASEHFASGMFSAALIGYLCSLCRAGAAGTDFAFVSSYSSLCRVVFSMISGWLADHVSWTGYYAIIFVLASPGLYLIIRYPKIFSLHTHKVTPDDMSRV